MFLGPGTYYLNAGLVVNFANTVLAGAGKKLTKLVRAASFGTVITNDTHDGTVLRDFSIDGGNSGIPTNANHGIRIFDSNNVLVQRVSLTNYLNSAILCFVTTAFTKTNVVYDDCDCDGLGVASNGFLLVAMDESGIRRCVAKNVVNAAGGPGYGLQLKNQCRYSFIEDSYANNCVAGFAFGNDNLTQSGSECRVTGGIAINCGNGLFINYSDHIEVDGLVIQQQAGNLEAIRIQGTSNNNAVIGTVVSGTPSPKGVVRFDDSAHDNFVELDMVDASAGAIGQFESTSANNMVVARRTGSSRPTSDKTGSSTGTGNSVWIHARPQDQIRLSSESLLGETMDRKMLSAQAALVSGTCYFTELPVRAGTVIANILLAVTTLGAGITLSKVALYKSDGTLLASSADLGASWTTTGLKTHALSASYTVPADQTLYVGIISVFTTTAPQMLKGCSFGGVNTAASGGILPYGAQTGQADLPSPATIVTGNSQAIWSGIS